MFSKIREGSKAPEEQAEPYDAIILKGNVRHLRPGLYDLLAHRALEYFTSVILHHSPHHL